MPNPDSVTEVMGNEQDTYSTDQLLQTIFNDIQEGLLVITDKGIVCRINEALSSAINFSPMEIVGRPLREVCKQSSLQRLSVVLQTGRPEYAVAETLDGRSVLVDYLPIKEKERVLGALAKISWLNSERTIKRDAASSRGRKKNNCPGTGVHYTVDQIIGASPRMTDLKETLLKVASRNSNVLITGESGTGKELFAQSIHSGSTRRNGPFIKINCAAIPDSLLESEFFGYEEGAFTGSKKGGQSGKLELAHGGTVFLDEIGDLSFSLQAKLLRFIQDKEIQKLGSGETIISDVRIVAATNVNLEQLVKYKKFREDLYYRLNVVNFSIPPLRERKEDIPELVEKFIIKFNSSFGFKVSGVSPEVYAVFYRYSWPGNVRELENTIERAFNVMDGNIIQIGHLPAQLVALSDLPEHPSDEHSFGSYFVTALLRGQTLSDIMEQTEKQIIVQTLMANQGNKARASQMLGISRPGLYKKLTKYGLL